MGSTFEDGRWHHRFRQSSLSEVDLCPERGRAALMGELPRRETDATMFGTAIHAAIEHVLLLKRHGGECSIMEAHRAFEEELLAIAAAGPYVSHKFSSWEDMLGTAWVALANWHDDVLPLIEPQLLEHTFELRLYEDEDRIITITGTIDCVDADGVVWDWKTGGRAYAPWEKQRWAIQPTVYCAAVSELGVIEPAEEYTFRYYVMVHGAAGGQFVDVQRDVTHFAWLRRKCVTLAHQIEQRPKACWPLNDTGWWCSDVWCGKWDECKGSYMEPEVWRQVRRPDIAIMAK